MARTVETKFTIEHAKDELSAVYLPISYAPTSLLGNIIMSHLNSVASGWWHDKDGKPLERNRAELLMLMVSELSEAMEGERKDLMDDKLPHRKMAEVELADACIRIFDYATACGYDLEGAIIEKTKFNMVREDHKIENRLKEGGKAF